MSTTYTEREVVKRERAAFMRGVLNAGRLYEPDREHWRALAARFYPLPKVTKPRTYTEGKFTFRVMGGTIVQKISAESGWYMAFHGQTIKGAAIGGFTIGGEIPATPTLLAALADLLENPTEEVDAE